MTVYLALAHQRFHTAGQRHQSEGCGETFRRASPLDPLERTDGDKLCGYEDTGKAFHRHLTRMRTSTLVKLVAR